VKTKVNSLRLDAFLKAGLGVSKKYFYISIFFLKNNIQLLVSISVKLKLPSMKAEFESMGKKF
jgi:hypothetical protein